MQNGWPRKLLGTVLAMLTATILLVAAVIPANALTLTFVRHGQSYGNISCCINSEIPGPGLTPIGSGQADTVAQRLMDDDVDYTSIFYSDMVRTKDTAAPFAALSHLAETELAGLHEVQAGIYEGTSQKSGFGRILFALTAFAWVTGNYAVPMFGSADLTGADFESRFSGAVQTIADTGGQNPVVFSHGLAIMAWTLMNVKNPDLTLMLNHILDNTAVVTVTGSPTEGWTLENWDGVAVTQNPALPTKLFVDFRNTITVPQMAVYNVAKALGTRNISKIAAAIGKGVVDTIKAVANFPVAVVKSVVKSIQTGTVFKAAAPPASSSTSTATATATATETTTATPAAQAASAVPQSAPDSTVKKPRPVRTKKAKTDVATDVTPASADSTSAESPEPTSSADHPGTHRKTGKKSTATSGPETTQSVDSTPAAAQAENENHKDSEKAAA